MESEKEKRDIKAEGQIEKLIETDRVKKERVRRD